MILCVGAMTFWKLTLSGVNAAMSRLRKEKKLDCFKIVTFYPQQFF
ncbi:hypothetical protein HMPREF0556_10936 [Listeria grayi DSM 20601]|uniref:Uncharacterized protein n=1 Tax=Listeria grayi DSM 20601 TaxID=525367 RepID=D7UXH5_LISGR|nr:hypothetical protein HMPREF0556_10936 [Listeria grayi DSM 20601]